ncbi:MAG TPA: hypothetical protein EYQ63_08280 [Fuerstia sp.]|nr:hypothetical protein [Fuerstiella sp.]
MDVIPLLLMPCIQFDYFSFMNFLYSLKFFVNCFHLLIHRFDFLIQALSERVVFSLMRVIKLVSHVLHLLTKRGDQHLAEVILFCSLSFRQVLLLLIL